MFLSNLQYYLGRLRVEEKFERGKKTHKSLKAFVAPGSYKVYDGLEFIGEDVECIERELGKTAGEEDVEEKDQSLAKLIKNAIQ